MKLKTRPLMIPFFSFVLDNPIRKKIENPEKQVKIMGVKPQMKVLEVGCGNGFFTSFLSKEAGDKGFVISIDVQKKMVDKASKKWRNLTNVKFNVEDTKELKSIQDNEIDIVFLYYSFHEIHEKEKAVKEFYRVLKNGGILSIKEPKFEVFKKDIENYKQFIIKNSFRYIESEKAGDILGRYLKFIKE